MIGKRVFRFVSTVFLVLALGALFSPAAGAGEPPGWIHDLMGKLRAIRAQAARKVETAERTAGRAEEVISLARKEKDPAAEQVAAKARSRALAAKGHYQRILSRADASLEKTAGLADLASRHPESASGAGVIFSAGEVSVSRGSDPQWKEPGSGDVLLRPGDGIRTGAQGTAELRLMGDGSRMDVGAKTSLRVENENMVSLAFGKVLFDIRKWVESKKRKFEVRTPSAICGVRGTRFAVFSDKDGTVTLTVLEGEVEFGPPNGEGSVLVPAGRRSVMVPGTGPSAPVEADPAEVGAAFNQ